MAQHRQHEISPDELIESNLGNVAAATSAQNVGGAIHPAAQKQPRRNSNRLRAQNCKKNGPGTNNSSNITLSHRPQASCASAAAQDLKNEILEKCGPLKDMDRPVLEQDCHVSPCLERRDCTSRKDALALDINLEHAPLRSISCVAVESFITFARMKWTQSFAPNAHMYA